MTPQQITAKIWFDKEVALLKARRAKGKVSHPHQKEGLSTRRRHIPVSRAEGIIFTRSPYVGSFKRDRRMERMNPKSDKDTRREMGLR